MTERQIKEARARLPHWFKEKDKLTKEQRLEHEELDIREYMLSCLAYNGDYFKSIKESWYINNSKYGSDENKVRLEQLGVKDDRQREKELWEEMKKDFAEHAKIHWSVGHDCEGLWYNSVEWDDE